MLSSEKMKALVHRLECAHRTINQQWYWHKILIFQCSPDCNAKTKTKFKCTHQHFWSQFDRWRSTKGKDSHLTPRWRPDISSCGTGVYWFHAPPEWNYLTRVHVLSLHICTVHLYPVVSIYIFASFVCINRRLRLPIPSTHCYNHLSPKCYVFWQGFE